MAAVNPSWNHIGTRPLDKSTSRGVGSGVLLAHHIPQGPVNQKAKTRRKEKEEGHRQAQKLKY